jgi:hypothetical protein
MLPHLVRYLLVAVFVAVTVPANAGVVLVQTSDPGYYNDSIGTLLNDTNGGETGPFPVFDDATRTFITAPNLSAASSELGNWLSDPSHLNANWSYLQSIPNDWIPSTEVAVMYRFDTLGATNVQAEFGVDNGIFIWLDGAYLFGARDAGSHYLGEYQVSVGDLSAGTHYLQLLLEDHGSANGYDVSITADTFVPGPGAVPEPSTLVLWSGLGAIGAVMAYRRKRRAA